MSVNSHPHPPAASRHSSLSRLRERAGVRALRRYGMVAGGVVGGLLALDLIGFVATVYFSAELLQAAEAAGVAGLLPR